MPCYEYRCRECELEFEVRHSMTETPIVVCPRCKSRDTHKVPCLTGVVVRNTNATRRLEDRGRQISDMRAELREDFGVDKIHPVMPGSTLKDVYRDVKAQASQVKEQMRMEAERNAAAVKAKQREWTKQALKRTPQRWKERQEKKAAEEQKKRAIVVGAGV